MASHLPPSPQHRTQQVTSGSASTTSWNATADTQVGSRITVEPPCGTHPKNNTKVVYQVGWFLVMSSFTWKCEGKGLRQSGLPSGMVLGEEFIYMEV